MPARLRDPSPSEIGMFGILAYMPETERKKLYERDAGEIQEMIALMSKRVKAREYQRLYRSKQKRP